MSFIFDNSEQLKPRKKCPYSKLFWSAFLLHFPAFELNTEIYGKHETIFYRNYKKFDNLKFKEALITGLMKHDLNNIDYEDFHEIVLSILNAHAPLKEKHL